MSRKRYLSASAEPMAMIARRRIGPLLRLLRQCPPHANSIWISPGLLNPGFQRPHPLPAWNPDFQTRWFHLGAVRARPLITRIRALRTTSSQRPRRQLAAERNLADWQARPPYPCPIALQSATPAAAQDPLNVACPFDTPCIRHERVYPDARIPGARAKLAFGSRDGILSDLLFSPWLDAHYLYHYSSN